jgi:hypothetical protein
MKVENKKWLSATLAAAGITGLAASACKKVQSDRGRVKVVENLTNPGAQAGTKLASPFCGGANLSDERKKALDNWLSGDKVVTDQDLAPVSAERMAELRQALSLVPVVLIDAMHQLKIRIQLVNGSPEKCSGIGEKDFYSSFTNQEVFSCARKIEGETSPVIYFGSLSETGFKNTKERFGDAVGTADASGFVVRHESVRNIGVVYARVIREFYEKLAAADSQSLSLADTSGASSAAIATELSAFKQKREALEAAFLADVDEGSGEGKNFAKELPKNLRDMRDRINAIKPPESAEYFRDYILAEVIDSYYCNAETRASLESKFKRTHGEFVNLFVEPIFEPQASLTSKTLRK